MTLNLKRLRQAVEIAKQGSFALAAEALGMSQPALSRSIQALEADLGGRLFDRGRVGAVPTPYGESVLVHARILLRQAEAARREIELVLGREAGELRIGSGPYPASISIGRAVGSLSRRHPQLAITVQVDDAESLTRQVLEGRLDLAVAELSWTGRSDRLAITALPRHPVRLFCRAGHPLAGSGTLTLDAVARFPLVATPLPARLHHLLRARESRAAADHERADHETRPQIQVNSFELIRRIVLESDAFGIAGASQIAVELETGLLQVLDLPVPGLESNYGVMTLAGRTASPAAEAFVGILREVEEELVGHDRAVDDEDRV